MVPCSILRRLPNSVSLLCFVGRGSSPTKSLRCFTIEKKGEDTNATGLVTDQESGPQGRYHIATDSCIPRTRPNLPAPTNCCMSGCNNCVWIAYAEEMLEHYKDGGEAAMRAVDQHIDDENIKMFIKMEIRFRMKRDSA